MILILAKDFDDQARLLAKKWDGLIMSPGDLSRAGWRYELPPRDDGALVASGQTFQTREITGVLTRLGSIEELDLPHIASEDLRYVTAEINAFLCACLNALPCPVLNRPTPNCLCGDPARVPFVSGDDGNECVVVIGDQCFGASQPSHAETALQVARDAGAELLDVRFRDGEFLHARLIPDLSGDDVAAAVYHLLSSPRRPVSAPVFRAKTTRRGSSILLWGPAADTPLSRVHEELQRIDAPVRLLDQRDVLDTEVCCNQVRVRGESVDLDAIRSVYLRYYDSTKLPQLRDGPPETREHAALVDSTLLRWMKETEAFVISPLDAMSVNSSKPLQARWISEFGWRIPQTLITTDPAAAREFWTSQGSVIYKSISSIRSCVSRLSAQHDDRFADVSTCPTQFQEFIPGVEYRVHVAGDEVFACKILSDADDYRYAGDSSVEYVADQLPPEIADRCRRMSAAMRLPVSGIDLRLTPAGQWVCFEVNPSPAFTSFEEVTGHPIASAIARLLVAAPPD